MSASSFACPHCGSVLKSAQPIPAGKRVRCPRCGEIFPAPAEDPGAAVPIPVQPGHCHRLPEASAPADEEVPRVLRRGRPSPPPAADEEEKALEDATDREDEDDERPRRPRRRKRATAGRNLVIGLVVGGVSLLLLAGGGTAGIWLYLTWDKNRGTGRENPLAYVPADSAMLMGFDFGTLLTEPATAGLVKGVLQDGFQPDFWERIEKATGLECKDLFDKAIYISRGTGPAQTRIWIGKSKVPFDQGRIRQALHQPVACRFQGKTYFQVQENVFNRLFMPSDRILILANLAEADLQALVSRDGTQPSLDPEMLDLARNLEKSHFWSVSPSNEATRRELHQKLPPGGPAMPVELQARLAVLEKVKAQGFSATLEGDQVKLNAGVRCTDQDAAERLRGWMQAGKDTQEQPSLLPFASGQSMSVLLKELTQNIRFSSEGAIAWMSSEVRARALLDAVKELQQQAEQRRFFPSLPLDRPPWERR